MPHYKDTATNEVFWFDTPEEQALYQPILVPITDAEAAALISPPADVPTLIDQKRFEIHVAYNAAVKAVVGPYPQSEIDTWPKQEAEARAYLANNTVPTPFLSAMVAAGSTTLDTLAAKVVANADAYMAAIGALLGKRQSIDAQLDALAANPATVQAEVDAIVW